MDEIFERPKPPSLRWILSLDDDSFVKEAFKVVLGREPDDTGFYHYKNILKKKKNRIQIISDLFHSDEGMSNSQNRDISDAVFLYKHPILSRISMIIYPRRYLKYMDNVIDNSFDDLYNSKENHIELCDQFYSSNKELKNSIEFKLKILSNKIDDFINSVKREPLGDFGKRYIFNITTSRLWHSYPVGIVRVEREIANFLRNFSNVDYVIWDKKRKSFKKLSGFYVDEILSNEWCDPNSCKNTYDQEYLMDFIPNIGDTYISMGLDWDNSPTSDVMKYLSIFSVKCVLTCFDTVPVKFPEFLVRDEISKEFRQHLVEMAHGANKVWAISQATKNDLSQFWESAELECDFPEIVTLPLASYSENSRLPTLDIHDQAIMRDVFLKGDYVLYVSSIEPRKNHKLMFDIWRELWDERGRDCPQFVFVGAVGWGCSDITQRVERMAVYAGGKINGLQRVSDALLQHLYHNCAFSVFPSIHEGWGLAATEAMQHGKVCIVSNTSSLGEATQNLMPALHPFDFPGWKAEIERLLDDQSYRQSLEDRIAKEYRPHTWRDVGERFCKELLLDEQK